MSCRTGTSPISALTSDLPAQNRRVQALDLWRGCCVWAMMAYHLAYDLALFGRLDAALLDRPAAAVYRFAVGGSFILLHGICLRRSRNPLRRGFRLFCLGLAVSLVMLLAGFPVAFGILQFMGASGILYALGRDRLRLRQRGWFLPLCTLLFLACWAALPHVRVGVRWLYPLGLRAEGFSSADYYPLLPWFFLTLTGVCLGQRLDKARDRPLFRREFPAWSTFAGRHSLAFYLIHQPVFYGLCFLLFH